MTDELPSMAYDPKPEEFPIVIELWGPGTNHETDEPTETIRIEGPGVANIPGLGWPTWSKVTYGNGRVSLVPPPAEDPLA